MDEHSSNKNPKRRRRALTWGIFGLAGVIMSTAWATGFGTSNSDATGTGPAQNAFGQGAVATESISEYATAVTAQAPLAITFDGLWGQIARSEERRVGKESVSTGRSRGLPQC